MWPLDEFEAQYLIRGRRFLFAKIMVASWSSFTTSDVVCVYIEYTHNFLVAVECTDVELE